jgi:hypothetical protein
MLAAPSRCGDAAPAPFNRDKENNYYNCDNNHLIPQKHPVVIIYKDFEDAEDNSGLFFVSARTNKRHHQAHRRKLNYSAAILRAEINAAKLAILRAEINAAKLRNVCAFTDPLVPPTKIINLIFVHTMLGRC